VGAKWSYGFNTLTSEGEALVDKAYADWQKDKANPNTPYPELDPVKQEYMALVNWYPIYGKMNMLDAGVAHFDFYLLGGYGQVQLESGSTQTYTGGAGVGFWISQHFTTRLEGRYQTYNAKYFSGDRKLYLAVASIQMGWLL
jgi:outer membrane beta-barrel protein